MRRHRTPLLLALIVRVPASMPRAAQSERVHFVVSGSADIPVTRSPIDHSVYDCWPIEHCASARKIPENVSSFRVDGVHLSGIRTRVHDAICDTHRAPVNGAWSWIRGLPKNLPCGDIKCAPRSPSNLLSRRNQGIGE